MAESETYCLCRCARCGAPWHEWIEMKKDSFEYALCFCDRCKMVVNALCIPADLHYKY